MSDLITCWSSWIDLGMTIDSSLVLAVVSVVLLV